MLSQGALGRGMMEKVKDLHDFLAINWEQGDEVRVPSLPLQRQLSS